MSNFLDNLAARTLQPSAVLRPRLAGLFEPHEEALAPPSLDAEQDVVALAPARDDLEQRPRVRPAAPELLAQQNTLASPLIMRPMEPPPRLSPDELRQAAPPRAAHDAAPPVHRPAVPTEGETTAAPRRTALSAAAAPAASPATLEPQFVAAPPPPVQPHGTLQVPHTSPARPVPIEPQFVAARARTVDEPRQAASSPAGVVPEPAPTIRVTIGRVEVRASTPPAPRPQSVRQRTAPSLDEYLQRTRERRR